SEEEGGLGDDEDSYEKEASFGGAPGAPPRQSAAPSKSMPPPPPRRPGAPMVGGRAASAPRGGSATGEVAVSREMMRNEPSPKGGGGLERAKKRKAAVEFDDAPMADLSMPEEQEHAEDRLEPAEGLLDYESLTLAPPGVAYHRGRLQPRPAHVTQAMLALSAVRVQVDVVSLVAVAMASADAVNVLSPPTWAVPPRESARHFDARFDADASADVPSDGAWHTVPMLTLPVEFKAEYVSVPSVEPRVFRTVRLDNPTPHPLLAGPVDVTLEDEFLMTSPLPTMGPGETQRLGLGVEEALQVARNTRFDEATGGMFGNSTVLTHHVSVELANHLNRPVNISVSERVGAVPESQKDIKVEETEVAPPWNKPTPIPGEAAVEGERVWRVSIPAGEKRSLKATWIVKLPASKMLLGGNRRT
ncbi:DUF4139 domain-containing protein, partial [Corallococcus terminator]